jgi:hypothetical protein
LNLGETVRLQQSAFICKRRAQTLIGKLGVASPAFRIRFSRSSSQETNLLLRRRKSFIEADFTTDRPRKLRHAFKHRGPTALLLFAACPPEVDEISIDIGDGVAPTSSRFGFSFNDPEIVLLPDPYFINSLGFADLRSIAADRSGPWRDRRDRLRWRGTDTGSGRRDCSPAAIGDEGVKARIRLCLIAASIPGADCLLSNAENASAMADYRRAGIFGDSVPQGDSINDRYAIDIDGHSNSWSNSLARMILGCCVFRVESAFGYRQWYHDRLIPWVHYVPVRSDMSDLAERVDWARSNLDEAEGIARAGQALALEMTVERELDFAVRTIREAS